MDNIARTTINKINEDLKRTDLSDAEKLLRFDNYIRKYRLDKYHLESEIVLAK